MQILFIIISFLSAYLLFQIQPVISKYFLPFFGGSSSVWLVTVLTFQILLVFGYLYGKILAAKNIRLQIIIHFLIVFLVVLYQFTVSSGWLSFITPGTANLTKFLNLIPATGLILGIFSSVGLLYLILSSTTNIIQTWFSVKYKKESPFFLYRASNLGSFAGLLAYPVLVEPNLSIYQQGKLFFYAFILYVILLLIVSLPILKIETKLTPKNIGEKKPSSKMYLSWIGLSSLTSMLMLAVSQAITQGVSFPLLWVLPLSLYLLSYVIGFRNLGLGEKSYLKIAYATTVVAFIFRTLENLGANQFLIQIVIYNTFLLTFGIVVHNFLYKIKPVKTLLTNFYLALSVGGAIGGILIAVIAPLIFTDYREFDISIILCVYVVTIIIQKKYAPAKTPEKYESFQNKFKIYQTFIMVLVLLLASWLTSKNISYQTRNFYGTLKVLDYPDHRELTNGRILHGIQLSREDAKYIPVSYYSKNSGLGLMMDSLDTDEGKRNIGVIGLGVGTLSSYCGDDTKVTFYEINPEVYDVAKKHFSFLDKCRDIEVKLGDGRLELEKEVVNNLPLYDVLVVDAFSDDSIPVHLLTLEAFKIYRMRLTTNGVIAVHISNRYLNLAKPIKRIAKELQLPMVTIQDSNPVFNYSNSSVWVLLSSNNEKINLDLPENVFYISDEEIGESRLWTDDFSSILPILKFTL